MEKTSLEGRVLYKNNQLIAVNKPAGIAVQPDKVGDKSLKDLVEIYCKHPVHIIHRVDRPASGVVLFAKNKKAAASLGEQFKNQKVEKRYLAVVKNELAKKTGKISHLLEKDGRKNISRVVEKETDNSKSAQLNYKWIASSEVYHLYEIELLTGRHHQIRAQLAAMKSPIKGDAKYGFRRGNRDRSIHLHAWKLKFTHPVSKEKVELTAPLPIEDSLWEFFSERCQE